MKWFATLWRNAQEMRKTMTFVDGVFLNIGLVLFFAVITALVLLLVYTALH